MYREEKIQSHIYRYTVQVPYSIWSLNICMGLYFLFPVRDASSQVDSTHNVVFIVERIYRKWSLYENPTCWIFIIPPCYPNGYAATGFFAHGRFGFSLHGRFHFLDRCWDFSKSRLKWILGSRVHRQLFWLLAGCFFYGNQSIFLVSGWMLFLWSSHIVDSVWTIFIVASFWVLGSLSGCPLTDIMRNVYMHVYWCIAYMHEMIFIAVWTMFN